VHILSFASHIALSHTCSSHYRIYKEFPYFCLNVPILTYEKSNWNSSSWHTLRGSSLYVRNLQLYDYQMKYMWVVINYQKGGDWKISRPLSGFWCLDDKTHIRLISLSSMCAGAKVQQAKHMMKYDPSKKMKKWWLKFTRRVDFCFSFEYRNPILSRETLIYRFWLRTSA
jgi:hypothetical protein